MSAKFEIKKATNGQFHFNLKAGNGEVILSSETYTTKEMAQNGIASVQANSPDDKHFDRREAKDGSPYFVLKAGNGQVIGKSEMYSSKGAMENGIASVKKNGSTTEIADLTTS